MTAGVVVLVGTVLVLIFWAVGACKRLNGLRCDVTTAFAPLTEYLKQRYALVPDLIDTAKSGLPLAEILLEAVMTACNDAAATTARAAAAPGLAMMVPAIAHNDRMLTVRLAQLLAAVHACTALRAHAGMQQQRIALSRTEERIGVAQRAYNERVAHYNAARDQFPVSRIAALFGFQPAALLQSERMRQPAG